MRIEQTYRTLYAKFDSWPEFVSTVEKSEPTNGVRDAISRQNDIERMGACGGLTYSGAIKMARYGWAEGVEIVKKLGSTFYANLSTHTLKPEMTLHIEGDEIDMGAYMTGDPECFLSWQDSEVQIDKHDNKHVVIDYSFNCSAAFSSDQLVLRGAYICALVDTLESVGRRVTLNLYAGRGHSNRLLYIKIQLKSPDSPLDIEKLTFAMCHAAALRRLVFGYTESLPNPWCPPYGCMPVDPPDLDGDIIINARTWRQASDNLADWAKQILIDQGVEFNG